MVVLSTLNKSWGIKCHMKRLRHKSLCSRPWPWGMFFSCWLPAPGPGDVSGAILSWFFRHLLRAEVTLGSRSHRHHGIYSLGKPQLHKHSTLLLGHLSHWHKGHHKTLQVTAAQTLVITIWHLCSCHSGSEAGGTGRGAPPAANCSQPSPR